MSKCFSLINCSYYIYCYQIIFSLSQSCNHVAAILFRVEAAVRAGLRDPTRTSQKAKWVVPASNTVVEVCPVSELDIEVHKYGKSSEF